jgi:hypothetical protein
MILLEVHNRIIEELLTIQIEAFLRKEKLGDLKTDVVGKLFEYCVNKRRKKKLIKNKFRF